MGFKLDPTSTSAGVVKGDSDAPFRPIAMTDVLALVQRDASRGPILSPICRTSLIVHTS
jgi:hypothetical protein